MRLNKKALSVIVATLLFLFIAVTSGYMLLKWITSYESEFFSNVEQEAQTGKLEILGINYVDSSTSVLGLRNHGRSTHDLYKISLNDQTCPITVGTDVEGLKVGETYINCTIEQYGTYEITVLTDRGLYSKTLTIFEEGEAAQGVFFRSSTTNCKFGETKLFGLYFINNSHAELSNQNNYGVSVCLKHPSLSFSNNCFGNYTRLFYLGNVTNSHVYVDNSTAYPGLSPNYYNWQEVCLSSSQSVSSQVNTTSPGSNWYCAAGIARDDVYGGALGMCSMNSEKLWIRVE